MKRVAVTGLGWVTPLGSGKDKVFEALLNGKSGIRPITFFDASEYVVKIAGECQDFDAKQYVPAREISRMDRFCHLAIASSVQAFEDSRLDHASIDAHRFGVIIGSGIGGILSFSEEVAVLLNKGPQRVSPFFIPRMIGNMASAQTAILLKAKGHTSNPCTACASGTNAIGEAMRRIQHGYEDIMIAGGSEASVVPIAVAGFSVMKALSKRNEEPEKASRPFDLNRDGFIIAEGAGTIVLEEWDHAVKRGAEIYAELVGYGSSCDAFHITLPDPSAEGPMRSMANALSDAGVSPQEIDYINAHGTSTKANDITETQSIKKLFGDHARNISIHSSKSMLGHLLGAAGGAEAIVTVLTLYTGKIHPTINLEEPDPECDLDYTPWKMRERKVHYGLSNSFGFGGHNFTLLMKGLR